MQTVCDHSKCVRHTQNGMPKEGVHNTKYGDIQNTLYSVLGTTATPQRAVAPQFMSIMEPWLIDHRDPTVGCGAAVYMLIMELWLIDHRDPTAGCGAAVYVDHGAVAYRPPRPHSGLWRRGLYVDHGAVAYRPPRPHSVLWRRGLYVDHGAVAYRPPRPHSGLWRRGLYVDHGAVAYRPPRPHSGLWRRGLRRSWSRGLSTTATPQQAVAPQFTSIMEPWLIDHRDPTAGCGAAVYVDHGAVAYRPPRPHSRLWRRGLRRSWSRGLSTLWKR